jgi:magnesium chelatase family protein
MQWTIARYCPMSRVRWYLGILAPAKIRLAHHGGLSVDEFPEFPRDVLEMLSQPLEDGCMTIARSAVTLHFLSSFMLVAAMNPCPCRH